MKSILLVKKFLGLVKMTSGLENASFSLPEWQAVKMIFFAPFDSIQPNPNNRWWGIYDSLLLKETLASLIKFFFHE